MDILIKSFNRPYYLDRCLFSINKHVNIGNGKIKILDDGTPQIYLDKIIDKYPNVIINKSVFYEEKVRYTIEGKRPEKYNIPINLWVDAAQKASENFILIEDDTWFINDINLDEVNKEIAINNVALTKLYWIGNARINQSKKEIPLKNIILLIPKLFTTIPAIYYFVFYKFDCFKIRKALRFFKINTDERELAYRTIYAVAGMIFNKNYFTKLWDNHQNSIDEGLQIFNAVKVFRNQNKNLQFARYKHEILRTGFISSATNQDKEVYAENVDMFVFNKLMNEAWLHNQLDVISSLPNDIQVQPIIKILDENSQKKILSKNWIDWVGSFKDFYIKMGCKID
ncbi:hypothetical protein [Flavobacterium sp.]|jgi:hypothetical protein|uniref:hypothetical protein n=1 Tax=Flavobacterium sp. TaxID=239 RepID=UPI0037BF1C3F